ncbi:dipeptide epimerase [Altererythrobacter salegens]|uniref:Dipeptide epimerase n=1 Tax=Croceibacterium salegens TaxID=1737568 RepID=A0A6I4SZ97_9SPHN|nr:dipeptide epimerase [Croceibacterium salegens]MXO60357.1 dipeptide epimerase [Croceibacterium salegens]
MAIPLQLTLRVEHFAFKLPFRITGHVFDKSSVVVAELSDGQHVGRGEGAGAYYLGDDVANMLAQGEAARGAIESGISREELQSVMPPGGARNAIDCALWDLEAKQTGIPAWKTAGLEEPIPLLSALTIGADTPDRMARSARAIDPGTPLKLKLTGELDIDTARLEAVRVARPDAWIGVDANQGYDRATLPGLLPVLSAASIALLEQPLARGHEADLEGLKRPMPFAADESALTLADTGGLVGLFDVVNIKLDKCGGLTEGLAIARRARSLGLGVMVGNMIGTSLSMAPSFLVGQLCDVVDLDGPTFLAADRPCGVTYTAGWISCPTEIWGYPEKASHSG